MKKIFFLLMVFPFFVHAQYTTNANARKGWYGSIGIGYGSYKLDIYNYAGGSDFYADQKLSSPVIWLGMDKKSIWQANNFVIDAGGELVGGFGVKNKITSSGLISEKIKGGWSIGIHALAKAGYLLGNEKMSIVPLVGLGPYYIDVVSGSGDNSGGNQIYGLQGYFGIDFQAGRFVITPQIHFGLASWGYSNVWIGANADSNVQNGQPGMFEGGVKVAVSLF